DVADADLAIDGQHPRYLGEHPGLVDRQVDHAVGDHDVDRAGRQRHVLDAALAEFDVGGAFLASIAPRQVQHFLGHVQSVNHTGGADATSGKQHVDTTARAEVEHVLPGLQIGDGGGVAAAERGRVDLRGQVGAITVRVETGAEALVDHDRLLITAARVSAGDGRGR